MPSDRKSVLLMAVRVALVVGVGIAAAAVLELAAMPLPRGDGFAHGMAAIIGGAVIVLTLGLAAIGVGLPAVLGFDDPLGFNRWQRLALKGAGVPMGGGIVVLAYGVVTNLGSGIVLGLGSVALAICVVCATLVWRFVAVFVRLLFRAVGAGSS